MPDPHYMIPHRESGGNWYMYEVGHEPRIEQPILPPGPVVFSL